MSDHFIALTFRVFNGSSVIKGTLALLICLLFSCEKVEQDTAKAKAPLRTYLITARLDNKQAGTDSKASGLLKGTYSEKTKLLTYQITYEALDPTSIRIEKGAKGANGVTVAEFAKTVSQVYSSPLNGEKKLNSLEERDLLKGRWFISIATTNYSPYEIRGMVTIKLK